MAIDLTKYENIRPRPTAATTTAPAPEDVPEPTAGISETDETETPTTRASTAPLAIPAPGDTSFDATKTWHADELEFTAQYGKALDDIEFKFEQMAEAQTKAPKRSSIDVWTAAFEVNNPIASFIVQAPLPQVEPIPGYSPFEDKGDGTTDITGYEEFYQSFMDSQNPATTAALKSRIDRERANQRILSNGGAEGILASIAAGLGDPINMAMMLLPLTTAPTVAKMATSSIAAGVAASATSELALHATQETRTIEDSMINVASTALLDGVLGGAAGWLKGTERKLVQEHVQQTLRHASAAQRISPLATGAEIESGPLSYLARQMVKITPLGRALQSNNPSVRATVQELTESSIKLSGDYAPVAVETLIKLDYAKMAEATSNVRRLQRQFVKEGGDKKTFSIELTTAMRNGDTHSNALIQSAAKELRGQIDNLWERAANLKIPGTFVEEVAADGTKIIKPYRSETAPSYMTRRYDLQAVRQDPEGFKQAWIAGLKDRQARMKAAELGETGAESGTSSAGLNAVSSRVGGPVPVPSADEVATVERLIRNEEPLSATIKAALVEPSFPPASKVILQSALKRVEELEAAGVVTGMRAVQKGQLASPGVATGRSLGAAVMGSGGMKVELRGSTLGDNIGTNFETFTHEVIHSATMASIAVVKNMPSKATPEMVASYAKLRDVFNTVARNVNSNVSSGKLSEIEELLVKRNINAMADTDELLAWGLTNPQFQAYLKTIKMPGTGATMWQTFVMALSKLLGLRGDTALDRLLEASSGLLNNPSPSSAKLLAETKKPTTQSMHIDDLDDDKWYEIANEIYERVTDMHTGDLHFNTGPSGATMFKQRVDIADSFVDAYLVKDWESLMEGYVKSMAPRTRLAERFGEGEGGYNMSEQFRKVKEGYASQIAALDQKISAGDAKLVKQRDSLIKQQASDLRDLQIMRDRLLNMTQEPSWMNPENRGILSALRAARSWNIATMLSNTLISSIPDLARTITYHGAGNFVKAFTRSAFSRELRRLNMPKSDMAKMASAMERTSAYRLSMISEVEDGVTYTRADKYAHMVADRVVTISGMKHWNSMQKTIAGHLIGDKIANHLLKGTGRSELKALGFTDGMYDEAVKQAKKFAYDDDGLMNLNLEQWESRQLVEMMEAAAIKEADKLVVTPGVGDKPLFMTTEMGRTLGQFKSFIIAATNKMTLPLLQEKGIRPWVEILTQVGLGAAVYQLREQIAGREPSDDPKTVMISAVENTGIAGYGLELMKMGKAVTGVDPLGKEEDSKFYARGPWGTLLGPSAQLSQNVWSSVYSETSPEQRAKAMRKLLPFQNHFLLRSIHDTIEDETTKMLGGSSDELNF